MYTVVDSLLQGKEYLLQLPHTMQGPRSGFNIGRANRTPKVRDISGMGEGGEFFEI